MYNRGVRSGERKLLVSVTPALLGAAALVLASALFAPQPTAAVLPSASIVSVFHIEKSENKNQVHYSLKVDADCHPIGTHPLSGYWRNLEDGPKNVSLLLSHEQPAYGLTEPRYVHSTETGGEMRVSLRGFPDRPLTIQVWKMGSVCAARATTNIQGAPAMLQSIYVKIGFLFSVDYAIVRGLRLTDAAAVQEKINE